MIFMYGNISETNYLAPGYFSMGQFYRIGYTITGFSYYFNLLDCGKSLFSVFKKLIL
ncbi:MAG: hypothetical protein WDO16_16490 [Bacteroidota bacterium]